MFLSEARPSPLRALHRSLHQSHQCADIQGGRPSAAGRNPSAATPHGCCKPLPCTSRRTGQLRWRHRWRWPTRCTRSEWSSSARRRPACAQQQWGAPPAPGGASRAGRSARAGRRWRSERRRRRASSPSAACALKSMPRCSVPWTAASLRPTWAWGRSTGCGAAAGGPPPPQLQPGVTARVGCAAPPPCGSIPAACASPRRLPCPTAAAPPSCPCCPHPPPPQGKVRDTYDLGDKLVLVTTDRQSAFDRLLAAIPFKGQVLNQTSAWWMQQTEHIVGNALLAGEGRHGAGAGGRRRARRQRTVCLTSCGRMPPHQHNSLPCPALPWPADTPIAPLTPTHLPPPQCPTPTRASCASAASSPLSLCAAAS